MKTTCTGGAARLSAAVLAAAVLSGCDASSGPAGTPPGGIDYESRQRGSLSATILDDLVTASSRYLAAVSASPPPQRQVQPVEAVEAQVYDAEGVPDATGRFGLISPRGSVTICFSDYAEHVSFLLVWDFAGTDGDTARLMLTDQANCRGDDAGYVEVKPATVTASEPTPALNGLRAAVASDPDLLRSIRSRFIGNVTGSQGPS